MRRVVVTGLGALTPVGNDVSSFWEGLKSGKSGAADITYFDTEHFKTKFACELKNFDVKDHLDRKEIRINDPYLQYALVTTAEAIADSGLNFEELDMYRGGVIWGTGNGGIQSFHNDVAEYVRGDGTPRFNPYFVPKSLSTWLPASFPLSTASRVLVSPRYLPARLRIPPLLRPSIISNGEMQTSL